MEAFIEDGHLTARIDAYQPARLILRARIVEYGSGEQPAGGIRRAIVHSEGGAFDMTGDEFQLANAVPRPDTGRIGDHKTATAVTTESTDLHVVRDDFMSPARPVERLEF